MQKFYEVFGVRLRYFRKKAGLSQQVFADVVGLTRASISNIEVGRQRILAHNIEEFAVVVGVKPETLMKGVWDAE